MQVITVKVKHKAIIKVQSCIKEQVLFPFLASGGYIEYGLINSGGVLHKGVEGGALSSFTPVHIQDRGVCLRLAKLIAHTTNLGGGEGRG